MSGLFRKRSKSFDRDVPPWSQKQPRLATNVQQPSQEATIDCATDVRASHAFFIAHCTVGKILSWLAEVMWRFLLCETYYNKTK